MKKAEMPKLEKRANVWPGSPFRPFGFYTKRIAVSKRGRFLFFPFLFLLFLLLPLHRRASLQKSKEHSTYRQSLAEKKASIPRKEYCKQPKDDGVVWNTPRQKKRQISSKRFKGRDIVHVHHHRYKSFSFFLPQMPHLGGFAMKIEFANYP